MLVSLKLPDVSSGKKKLTDVVYAYRGPAGQGGRKTTCRFPQNLLFYVLTHLSGSDNDDAISYSRSLLEIEGSQVYGK